jgi:hypothetical protein
VLFVRLDATVIAADGTKKGAAGNYKGGFGFHPLTAWCSNVGDSLAVMLRPGNAGSFTAGLGFAAGAGVSLDLVGVGQVCGLGLAAHPGIFSQTFLRTTWATCLNKKGF